jgi:hypothetical protein
MIGGALGWRSRHPFDGGRSGRYRESTWHVHAVRRHAVAQRRADDDEARDSADHRNGGDCAPAASQRALGRRTARSQAARPVSVPPRQGPAAGKRTTMSAIQTARRGLWLAAPLAAGVILLAGCGSSAGSTQSTAGGDASEALAPSGDMQAFTSCLAEHGVTLPNAGTGRGAPPSGGARPSGAAHAPGTPPAGGNGAAGATPPPPPGVDPGRWDAAMKACGDMAPANLGTRGAGPAARGA